MRYNLSQTKENISRLKSDKGIYFHCLVETTKKSEHLRYIPSYVIYFRFFSVVTYKAYTSNEYFYAPNVNQRIRLCILLAASYANSGFKGSLMAIIVLMAKSIQSQCHYAYQIGIFNCKPFLGNCGWMFAVRCYEVYFEFKKKQKKEKTRCTHSHTITQLTKQINLTMKKSVLVWISCFVTYKFCDYNVFYTKLMGTRSCDL